MPIEIKHGGGNFGALAALSLLAGQMQASQQAPQAPQIRDIIGSLSTGGGRGGGGGGGGLRRRATRKRQEDGKLDEYNRMMLERKLEHQRMQEAKHIKFEQMQEEARLQQEGWKLEYSTKDRYEIAKIENARKRLWADPRFSQEEKMIGDRELSLKQMGITKSRIPPDPNEPQFIEGQEPGKLWEHEGTGSVMRTVIKDGIPTPEIVLRPDQTMQYLNMKLQAAQKEAEINSRVVLEKEMRATRAKLSTEWVPELKDGQPTGGKRLRSGGEVNAQMWSIYGPTRQQQEFSQQPPPLEVEGELVGGRQQPEVPRPETLTPLDRAIAQGMEITDEDRQLPGNVGTAQAYLRFIKKKYRGRINRMQEGELMMAKESERAIREYMER